ncbi:solute carrier family 35 member G1-like [Glandiceps talaboti]
MDPPYSLVPILLSYDSDDDNGLFSWQSAQHSSKKRRSPCHEKASRAAYSAIGVLLGLISGSSYAISSVFIVLLQNMGVTQFQVKFITGFVGALTVLPLIFYKRVDVRLTSWKDRIILLGNGAIGTVSCIALLYALPNAPLGNINSLIQGSLSIITALLACICLKEVCSLPEVAASLLSVTGILLITRPEFLAPTHSSPSRRESIAYILTLVSVVGISAGYIIGRAVRERVHVFAIMLYNSSVNTLLNFALMFIITPSSNWNIPYLGFLYLFAVCAAGVISTWARYESLRMESAASVALLSNIQLVISYLADIFIFHYNIHPLDFVGAGVVVLSSVIVSIFSCKKKLDTSKEKSKIDEEPGEMTTFTREGTGYS